MAERQPPRWWVGSVEGEPWTRRPMVHVVEAVSSDVLDQMYVVELDPAGERRRFLLGFQNGADAIRPGFPAWATAFTIPDDWDGHARLRVTELAFVANVRVGCDPADVPGVDEGEHDRRRRGWTW